jgi:cytochrome P450 family 114
MSDSPGRVPVGVLTEPVDVLTEPVDVLTEIVRTENLVDPHPFLAWVRNHDPVHHSPSGVYLVSRYADGHEVLQNSTLFRNPEPDEFFRLFPTAHQHRSQLLFLHTVIMNNPPAHTRLRRLIFRDFTAGRIETLRGSVGEISDRLIAAVVPPYRDGQVVDLNASISSQLPVHVFGELLGIPEDDRAELQTKMPLVLVSMHPGATEEQLLTADETDESIERYFADLVSKRRRNPQDDLLSALVTAHDNDPDMLSFDELMSMLWGLWAGGWATTVAAINYGVLTMLRHSDQVHWLRAGPGEAQSFVDELLRYEAPAAFSAASRYPRQDVRLSGVTVPEGADVRVLFNACNRDPDMFEEPDRFDPSRPFMHRTHLSFGHGLHYCLGAALARMELSVILPKIDSSFPDLTLAGQPAYRPALPVRTIDHLPVAMDAA